MPSFEGDINGSEFLRIIGILMSALASNDANKQHTNNTMHTLIGHKPQLSLFNRKSNFSNVKNREEDSFSEWIDGHVSLEFRTNAKNQEQILY